MRRATRLQPYCAVVIILTIALSVGAPSSSSAVLPAFYKGGAPLAAGEAIGFSTTARTVKIKPTSQNYVECSAGAGTGKTNGPNEVKEVKLTFSGCKNSFGKRCRTPGDFWESLETTALKGSLGYLKRGAEPAGLLLTPVTGRIFMESECEGSLFNTTETIEGSVISEVKTKKLASPSEWESLYEVELTGFQKWMNFEENMARVYYLQTEASGLCWHPWAIVAAETISVEAPNEVEIKAK